MAKKRKQPAEGGGDVELAVVRVFCGEGGEGGNELGVVVNGAAVPPDDRQALARHLGYAETVFVDDAETGRVRIFTPAIELPFAGHPVVGTGWLLRQRGHSAKRLLTPAGAVELRHEDKLTWATGEVDWCPPFELVELGSADEVEAAQPATEGWQYLWAWTDEDAGHIRSRCFVPEAGIVEDEATGSAALRLADALDCEITVKQGRGSVIQARPVGEDRVEIGGRVELA
ncbi:MAG: PhzF family phenazine biosynthesis protein [Solirubrobacterales bacterium]